MAQTLPMEIPAEEREEQVEHEMDTLVGYILLGGVLISVVLIIASMVVNWVQSGQFRADYLISGMNLFEFMIADIKQMGSGVIDSRLLMNLGILTLLLTPYIRVFASMLFFALAEHNWKYTVFTAFVLSVLTYSLLLR